jgi:hypothetical protein
MMNWFHTLIARLIEGMRHDSGALHGLAVLSHQSRHTTDHHHTMRKEQRSDGV